jgi:hypothetical protein
LYRTRYQGFTARHFHEHLVREHRFAWSYSWTKAFLQSRHLLPKAERRGAHRRRRPRRPLPGMMLHQDASLCDEPPLDLVVTMGSVQIGRTTPYRHRCATVRVVRTCRKGSARDEYYHDRP